MRIYKTTVFFSFLVLVAMLIQGCSSTKAVHPTLQATLWVQNAVEFDALASMSYQTAETKLEDALMDKSWAAELTQVGTNIEGLPPAIILDIDETVLDNSPYQARMVQKGSGYDPVEWEKWVLEANASAISGAVSFTNKAADEGITVIYLSNREANTEEATRKNLEDLGFPLSSETDVVLLKNELTEWTSSKIERRKHVASQYRILMLFGDDFNDFLPAKNISESERDNLLDKYRTNFGLKWFILPNPIYGSWDQALYNFDRNLSEEKKSEIIEAHLHTKN